MKDIKAGEATTDENRTDDAEELATTDEGEELTDEQLLQMAEGSCTWGANCGRG
ncbi:hypothetical protein [Sorangium sp. So ce1182]|uniref:hypothetical protein n=1 Tax=Sorangium sp. So ce1182 TaxID=3133334 RepID=UPI003EFE5AED